MLVWYYNHPGCSMSTWCLSQVENISNWPMPVVNASRKNNSVYLTAIIQMIIWTCSLFRIWLFDIVSLEISHLKVYRCNPHTSRGGTAKNSEQWTKNLEDGLVGGLLRLVLAGTDWEDVRKKFLDDGHGTKSVLTWQFERWRALKDRKIFVKANS